MQNNNEYILALVESGSSVIPITEGAKNPHPILGPKHDLLIRRATPAEVEKWIAGGVKSWAIAGGPVSSNLMTLDFDEKHYSGLFDLWYAKLSDDQKKIVDTCYKNSTRNNGTHLRYRTQTSQSTIKLARRVELNKKTDKEEIVATAETRGEGSYALIPPSAGYTTTQGSLLDLPIVPDAIHEELIDVLRTFNEVMDEPATEYEWKEDATNTGDRPGDRLNQIASWKEILEPHGWVEEAKDRWRRPGKDKGEGISATTNYDGKQMLYVFSSSAAPFEANRGYSKFHTFTLLKCAGNFSDAAKAAARMYPQEKDSQEDSEATTQADSLLEIVKGKDNVILFHDGQQDAYISMKRGNHQEIVPLKSKVIRRWLTREFWEAHHKAIKPESVRNAIAVLEGNACFDGPLHELHNRLAWDQDTLWYDLTDEKWRAIKINGSGWEIVNDPPILFRRYPHSQSQVIPSAEGGNIDLLFKYVNITNPEHKLLLLIYLISCFVPDFPHPILVIFGPQGSAKTTLSRLLRRIVDPSFIEVASMPDSHREMVQALAHHAFLFFDNISFISEEVSDLLCKATTGSGFVKRELYSDDEDIIYRLKRCIGINGINLVATRPDLLDRSLLLELERIEDTQRKTDKEIMDNFEKDLPLILGGIFDVLSKTLQIKPDITLSRSPRMADFACWGSAIAEAIGSSQEEFLSAYQNNIEKQTETILNENMVATVLIAFMEARLWEKWEGTMTELLERLTNQAAFGNKETVYDKYWPKAPNVLSRALNTLKTTLRSADISIIISAGQTRRVAIEKISLMDATKSITDNLFTASDTVDIDDNPDR